ncbi:Actin-related protein 5 [Schistosoma japonicum]|nr:Actin-related protein 5 [Schistosoma japonicum]
MQPRKLTELLFESFNTPKLMYYVDCFASYYNFQRSGNIDLNANCLLISVGYQRTHIVPIFSFHGAETSSLFLKPLLQAARRLHAGGAHANWMIQRLLQLKYPCHSERINGGLAERLAHSYCRLAPNYRQEMIKWKSDEFRRSHTIKVQLPFTKPSTEDLKLLADRRLAQTERLLSVHRKRQQKQFESTQQRLNNLTKVEKLMRQGDSPIVKQVLSNLGLSLTTDLRQEINACRRIMEKLQMQLNLNKVECSSSTTKVETTSCSNDQINEEVDEEKASLNLDSVDESQQVAKLKSPYTYLLEIMSTVYANSFSTVTNELTGRYKRAAELLISQSLPSSVQTQMSLNTTSSDCKFTETKLRHRIEMARDIEFVNGEDFALWLNSIRDRRVYVSKKRAQRQSRVDLATQIGLHTNDQFDIESDPDDFITQSKSSVSTQPNSSVNNSARSGMNNDTRNAGLYRPGEDKYDDSKKVLTERRRMQLEKIRAMAAELKPSRGRSRGNGRGIRPGGTSRGSLKTRGRSRGLRTESDNRVPVMETNPDVEENDTFVDDSSDLLGFDDSVEQIDHVTSSNSLNRLWDPDVDENTNEDSNLSSIPKKTNAISDYRADTTVDESEDERDQLAVIDSLLALYDPEASKDLGVADLKVDLDQFYQIHVDTELMRSHEVLFQPSFMGSPEAGLSDCLEYVLRDTTRLLGSSDPGFPQIIYLTGGVAALPGLADRIRCDIRPLLPVGSKWDNIEIIVAADPHLDAWHGARHFVNSPYVEQYYTTKQMYEEYGSYYFKDHPLGNRYCINTS